MWKNFLKKNKKNSMLIRDFRVINQYMYLLNYCIFQLQALAKAQELNIKNIKQVYSFIRVHYVLCLLTNLMNQSTVFDQLKTSKGNF